MSLFEVQSCNGFPHISDVGSPLHPLHVYQEDSQVQSSPQLAFLVCGEHPSLIHTGSRSLRITEKLLIENIYGLDTKQK